MGFPRSRESCHVVALEATWYDFVRIHRMLRCITAMEAGVLAGCDRFSDMVALMDEWETNQRTGESQ